MVFTPTAASGESLASPAEGEHRGAPMSMIRGMINGAAAGAAGTTALNAVTYLDMAVRGRGTSSTPEQTVEALAEKVHVPIPGDEEKRQNRVQGLGPLTGLVAGIGVGGLTGLARAAGLRSQPLVGTALTTVAVLIGSNGPMTVLGITDPRS